MTSAPNKMEYTPRNRDDARSEWRDRSSCRRRVCDAAIGPFDGPAPLKRALNPRLKNQWPSAIAIGRASPSRSCSCTGDIDGLADRPGKSTPRRACAKCVQISLQSRRILGRPRAVVAVSNKTVSTPASFRSRINTDRHVRAGHRQHFVKILETNSLPAAKTSASGVM